MKKVGIKSGRARPRSAAPVGSLHKAAIDRVAKPPISHPNFPKAFIPGAGTVSDDVKGK